MSRTGFAYLPLHCGWAPAWLVKRMKELARNITLIMVDELGRDEFLRIAIDNAKINEKERVNALRRLRIFAEDSHS